MSESESQFDKIATRPSLLWQAHYESAESSRAARNALVLRYRRAIRSYLGALLKNSADADEVLQRVILSILEGKFATVNRETGRFRDYLRRSVRNAALAFLRERNRVGGVDPLVWESMADEPADSDDDQWLPAIRSTILDEALTALDDYERRHAGNAFASILRLVREFPDDDSVRLAARLSEQTGRAFTPEATRQQLSRARRKFAEFIWLEVRQTLKDPSPENVTEELAAIGLMEYVREFLGSHFEP